jgi:hypothetical protein
MEYVKGGGVMRIEFHYEDESEKITNFRLAEAVLNLCNSGFNNKEFDAEVIAKMLLLEVDARKGCAE